MSHNYPHLNDSNFPNVSNVNVYNPANNVDYESEYDRVIAKITLLSVPWDVGLVHVGQAQIGGVGHVWYAGSKEARNAWFERRARETDALVHVWETEYRRFHAKDLEIKLEITATEAAKYNYCLVEYYRLPHETDDPSRRLEWWGFFVREWKEEAADTSTAVLLRDAWQTFIYDMDIPYMFLTRGHAPMATTTADEYLEDPVANNEWLLAPDVDFSNGAYRNVHQTAFVFNEDVWACVAVTGFTRNGWGTPESTWKNAGDSFEKVQSVSTTDAVLAMAPDDLETFLRNVDEQAPQFKQNISAVFFIGKKLVTRANAFSLFGVTVGLLNATRKRQRFITLTKEQFGFDEKYADIAKLYTQPYSHIEVTTENGETIVINVEDTHGEIDLTYSANLVYPFLSIDAHLLGVGGGEDHNLSFMNLEDVSFDYGGAWYGTLKRWEIPTFAVVQPSQIRANYQTWYLRQQQALEAETAKSDANAAASTARTNANASAEMARQNAYDLANTAKTNADNSASTAKTNAYASADATYSQADNSADNITANNATTVALASAMKSNDNSLSTEGRVQSTTKLGRDLSADRTVMNAAYQAESETNAVAQMNNNTQAAAGAASTALSIVGGVASGAMSGGPAGAVMGALGGISQGINTYASWTTANAALGVQMTNIYETYLAGWNSSYNKYSAAFDYMVNSTIIQINYTDANINLQNNANTTVSNRNAALMRANANIAANTEKNNANRTYNTATTNSTNDRNTSRTNAANTETVTKNNATRDYNTAIENANRDYNTAISAIANALKQAELEPNAVFGTPMAGQSATTKPQALFASIVTQSKSAIAQAGDEFLRFGYNCNRQWQFESWLVMPKFTFWQCEEVWIRGLSIADAYADEIRFFLMGGVTVWRNPEDIGNVSIYNNK